MWHSAKIVDKLNALRSYVIQDQNDTLLRRNSKHVRKSNNQFSLKPNSDIDNDTPNSDITDNDCIVNVPVNDQQNSVNANENVYKTGSGRTVKFSSKVYLIYNKFQKTHKKGDVTFGHTAVSFNSKVSVI